MAVDYLNINGNNVMHTLIPIIKDGACLFRALSYIMKNTQNQCCNIRQIVVSHIVKNWDKFSAFSENDNGDNYPNPNSYSSHMSQHTTYAGFIELTAAAELFPYCFEVYRNNELYEVFGTSTNPIKRLRFTGNLSNGHFDVYEYEHRTQSFEDNQTQSSEDHLTQTSEPKRPAKKRRARFSDATRKKQLKSAKKSFLEKNPASHQISNQKYQQNHPEIHRKASAKYQQQNPEIHRAAAATYQQQNPEVHRAAAAKYQQQNPELHRAAAATYQQQNPEVHRAAAATYQQQNPEVHRAAAATYQQQNPEVHRAAAATYQQQNPEFHRENQSRYESNNPGVREDRRRRPWTKKFSSAMEYNIDINYETDPYTSIGTMNSECRFCGALKWKSETPGMCCSSGKVNLLPIQPPPEPLYSLLHDSHPEHNHFISSIRKYNGCFQMTSFGANQVIEDRFMPTFKVLGQVYHLVGSVLPLPNQDAQFLQIYFVGEDERETTLRCSHYPGVKPAIVKQLQNMLHEHNDYIKDFKTTLEKVPHDCDKFEVVIHADRKPAGEHAGRYNASTASEIALVISGQQFENRDIVLQSHDNNLRRISEIHRSYDSLQYPLLFCRGEDGYSINQPYCDPATKLPLQKGKITASDFYSYRLMLRKNEPNFLLFYGALFSQFLVDMFAKIETERLNYIRHNQNKLRVDEYVHLKDAIGQRDVDGDQLGKLVVLPSSFTGGPRYMHERAQDAMTYVRCKGRPDLFITFTCNPKWPEIKEALFFGQKPQDRHDIIARIFHLKHKALMNLLVKGCVFGQVECYMYSVEWQKRGLPHTHILLWLKDRISSNLIDKVVCAEIPDVSKDPQLHEIVKSNMIHGPCGNLNINSPCMKEGRCTKKYPRPLLKDTQTGEDGYPKYRRLAPNDGGFTVKVKDTDVDNGWVVPYNPVLLRTFNAHINVEICNSVKSIKYICKYINKGSDQAAFGLHKKNDEINEVSLYESGRYISSSEAVWRILGFSIHERYPAIVHLAVHLENGQRVYFTSNNLAEKVNNPRQTTLMAFFDLCQKDDFAKTLLYSEVPSYYVWKDNKRFERRKRGSNVDGWPGVKKDSALGRVYTVHPNNVECYHLRLLLHEIRGPTSFEYLKTVNNFIHPTYQSACKALGLLENDDHWDETLRDVALCESPSKMRQIFVVMLVFCHLSDPLSLWEYHKDSLSEDFKYLVENAVQEGAEGFMDEIYNKCLITIEDAVMSLGASSLKQYGLPQPIRNSESFHNIDYLKELDYNVEELKQMIVTNENLLTEEQNKVYQQIIKSVDSSHGQIYFLDAPGGTGKTFLINLLLAKVRSKKHIALAAASSGIAATLLEGGKTAHSTFKLPLNLNYVETPKCEISKQSNKAKILKDCKLIVWDESTMMHKGGFEALDRTLQDIRNNNLLMGGVTVLLAGDFRQTLPVVQRGTRADEVKACIKSSRLWPHIKKLSLTTNMRVYLKNDSSAGIFSELLLKIGNGEYPEKSGKILIPETLGTIVNNLDQLIKAVYPDISRIKEKHIEWFSQRAILTPKNDIASDINDKLLESFEEEIVMYKSVDKVLETEQAVNYPVEFLNSQNPPGFPAHLLRLKVGTPIMLLRNLNPPKLCNGTRLQVTALKKNFIEATIFTGCAKGESVFIPRIPLIPSDYPFQFKRLQFPVRPCFAITINKSQGQTLKFAGIDLREDCFSHGQLYVGCSRVSSSNNLVILSPHRQTTNVVYKEVLSKK